jgi:hypothetical protein
MPTANPADPHTAIAAIPVLRFADCRPDSLQNLLRPYGLGIELVAEDHEIPGSYWGDEEAGLIDSRIQVRSDTPLHSILHEACHYICMEPGRREGLHTDAGGGYDEENAVCYLQILLSRQIAEMGQNRMFRDMDAWGYSFRLGSARAWFEQDAADAHDWLITHQLISLDSMPTGRLRGTG